MNLFDSYPSSLMDRFTAWNVENPDIYSRFVYMARQLKAQGRTKCSARHLIEVIRWEEGKGKTEEFKINSDYVPIMARMLMDEYPEMDGFFEIRAIRSRDIKSEEQRERELT